MAGHFDLVAGFLLCNICLFEKKNETYTLVNWRLGVVASLEIGARWISTQVYCTYIQGMPKTFWYVYVYIATCEDGCKETYLSNVASFVNLQFLLMVKLMRSVFGQRIVDATYIEGRQGICYYDENIRLHVLFPSYGAQF